MLEAYLKSKKHKEDQKCCLNTAKIPSVMINVDSFAKEMYLQQHHDKGHCEAAHAAIIGPS